MKTKRFKTDCGYIDVPKEDIKIHLLESGRPIAVAHTQVDGKSYKLLQVFTIDEAKQYDTDNPGVIPKRADGRDHTFLSI